MATIKKGSRVKVVVRDDETGKFVYVTGIAGLTANAPGLGTGTKITHGSVHKAKLVHGGQGFQAESKGMRPASEVMIVVSKDMHMSMLIEGGDGSGTVVMAVDLHLVKPTLVNDWNAVTRKRGSKGTAKKTRTGRKFEGKAVYRGARGGLFTESRGRRTYI